MSPRGANRPAEQGRARPAPDLAALLQHLENDGVAASSVSIRVAAGGGIQPFETALPDEIVALLRDIVAEFAKGSTVSVVPAHRDLTSAEAARFLGVSRPHLVSLLDAGRIPSYKVGTHRRVRQDDLLEFRRKLDQARKHALDDLAAHDEKLGLSRG